MAPAERRARARRRSFGRKLGLAVFATLSGALAFSLLTDGGRQTRDVIALLPATEKMLAWTGLRLEQVELSGQRFTSDADIFDAIDLPNARSLLTLNVSAVRARIEKLPWIATARLSRVFPGSLDVEVSERKPAALWQRNGNQYLIDATGRVLSPMRPGMHIALPRVAGEGAASRAQELLDLVARYPRIAERFEEAERIGERRWTLRLRDNVTVHLGADREAMSFAALSSPDHLGTLLSGHDIVIDLRARGRITVRSDTSAITTSATQG
jgi:cell division protein FtsQ